MTSPTPTTPEALAACAQARAAFNAAAEPKEGDRVLVQLEATFRSRSVIDGRHITYVYDDEGGTYALPQVHAVSVIAAPRPPEPTGLGAVVEDAEGFRYVRAFDDDTATHPWHVLDLAANKSLSWWKWADIDSVRVLSEGVTP